MLSSTSTDGPCPAKMYRTSKSLLTPKQGKELQLAILDYLAANQATFSSAHKAFAEELGEVGLRDGVDQSGDPLVLEQKWTSVIRLQKRIFQLESDLQELKTNLQTASLSVKKSVRSIPTWRPTTCKYPLVASSTGKAISALAFQPTSSVSSQSLLATGSEDCFVRIWNVEEGECIRILKDHIKPVTYVAWDAEGSMLVSCSADTTIRLYQATDLTFSNIRTFYGHDHTVSAVVFISVEYLASVSRDRTLRIWKTSTGDCTAVLNAHDEWVRCLAIDYDSSHSPVIATGSQDKSIKIWNASPLNVTVNTASRPPQFTWVGDLIGHQHVIEAVLFAPPSTLKAFATLNKQNGLKPAQLLFSCARDNSIRLWNLVNKSCLLLFEGHTNWVRGMSFTPSGNYMLSVSDDKSLRTWGLDGKMVHTVSTAHSQFLSCVGCHSNAGIVATASVDGSLRIWTGNEGGVSDSTPLRISS